MKLAILSFTIIALSFIFLLFCEFGVSRDTDFIKMKILGGISDSKGSQNSAEIDSIARFAVKVHNKKENALLEFSRVVKAKEQVVAGKMYHLTLEAIDVGKCKVYEARVWVKPRMNFTQLLDFKATRDASSLVQTSVLKEVIENNVKWDFLTKLRRGSNKQKLEVVANSNFKGKLYLYHNKLRLEIV